MSRTYGYMQGSNNGQVTRCGHHEIWAKLKTWNGSVDVTVYDDESCKILIDNLDVTINGGRMFAKRSPPLPMTDREMIKSLRANLKGLEDNSYNLPDRNIRELGPLIELLTKMKKELTIKLNIKKVTEELQ